MPSLQDRFAVWGAVEFINGKPQYKFGSGKDTWTVSPIVTGRVSIDVKDKFTNLPVVTANANDGAVDVTCAISVINNQRFEVLLYDNVDPNRGPQNVNFNFFAIASVDG